MEKALGNLSADISGMETANEQHSVKQIMKPKIVTIGTRAMEHRQTLGCSKVAARKPLKVGEWKIEDFIPPIKFQPSTNTDTKPMNTTNSKAPQIRKPGYGVIVTAVVGLIGAVILAPMLTQAEPAANHSQPIGYSREALRDEQRTYNAYLDRATIELKAAQDRLASGLPSLAERNLITTLLYLDAANIRMQGHEERMVALRPSPLTYSRDKQIQILQATHADLRAQAQRIEDSAFEAWTKQTVGVTNGWNSLPLYVSQRANFALRFKDQSLSPDDLIGDIQLLQDYPFPLVLSSTINAKNCRAWVKLADGAWRSPVGIDFLSDGSLKSTTTPQVAQNQKVANDPTATALKQLERRTSELNQAVNQLRRNQSNLVNDLSSRKTGDSKETPTVAQGNPQARPDGTEPLALTATRATGPPPTTNSAVNPATSHVASITTILPANATDALPTALATPTNTHQTDQTHSLTTSVAKTNETPATAAISVGGNAGDRRGKAEQSTFKDSADPTTGNAVSHNAVAALPRINPVWLISIVAVVLVLIVAVVLGLAFANRRQSDFEISLTCGLNGHQESITLAFDPNEQCVVLSGERPNLEARGAESDQPCILVRSFGGPQLRPGETTEVRLNGEPITKPKRLCVGDVVQINTSDHGRSFTFQGGNFVSGEEQPTSFESATTTIN
jgi:hypothetical protein